MNEEKPDQAIPEARPRGETEDGFWDRAREMGAARRGFFWLLAGTVAAIAFFGSGASEWLTPQ